MIRSKLFQGMLLSCAVASLFPLTASGQITQQITGFTITSKKCPDGVTGGWSAPVDQAVPIGSSQTAITYYLISRFGDINPGADIFNPAVSSISIVNQTSVDFLYGDGNRCFVVVASDTWHNGLFGGIFAVSQTLCHNFVHNPGNTNSGIARGDSTGGQLGFGAQWNFSYFLDNDALVTMSVYPPGTPATAFSTDPVTGLTYPAPAIQPTKVIIDHVPRSTELCDGSWKNTDSWDSRDSSGTLVSNGLYILYMQTLTTLFGGTTRFAELVDTIPVDVLRIMNIKTTGITLTSSLATYTYDLTNDATVRIVVARPGHKFTIDSSGNVQALDATNSFIDASTNSVVQVFQFNRKAALAITETWNGTDSLGLAVSTGIYPVGISATDAYGNHAVDGSGRLNDNGFLTTFTVDRTASQQSAGVNPPSVQTVSVGGTNIALGGGTSIGVFQSIVITLSGVSGNGTTATLTNPSGVNVAGSLSISSNVVTFTAGAVQSSTGTYSLVIVPKDSNANAGQTVSTTFTIPSSGGGGGGGGVGGSLTQTSDQFASSIVPAPNPAVASSKISFTLTAPSTVNIEIYAMNGNRVFHTSNFYSAGTNSYSWTLTNDAGNSIANGVYIARITMGNSLQTLFAKKKIMVLR